MDIIDAFGKINISSELSNMAGKEAFYNTSTLDQQMISEKAIRYIKQNT